MSIYPTPMTIIVGGSFTADHCCVEGMPHRHTWEVMAWFTAPERADARLYRESLDMMLRRWDGTLLPDGRDWNEDLIAELATLCNCVRVRVWRAEDRLGAEWSA